MSSSRDSGTVKIVSTTGDQADWQIDVLLVPAISHKNGGHAFTSPQLWLQNLLPPGIGPARVLRFEYSASILKEDFSCQTLLVHGDALLNQLSSHQGGPGDRTRPLLAIGHSTGGLVLKQALCIAKEQSYRYGYTLGSVAGLILLGVPHRGATSEDTLSKLLHTVASTTNLKRPIEIRPDRMVLERSMLEQLASRFESINLQVPVLTVVGSKSTKVYGSFLKSKLLLLNDQAFCTTDAPMEQNLTIPVDHITLSDFRQFDSKNRSSLMQFIKGALEDAESLIARRLQALDFKHATTSTYSPVESEFPERWNDSSGYHRDSTGRAVPGSSDQGFEIVPGLSNEIAVPRTIKLPCIMLESQDPSRVFHGQHHILNIISEALLPASGSCSGSGLRQFALCGLGGMGKTEIAREFANQNQGRFDAVFWVRADEPAKLDACFLEMSVRLGLETVEEANNQVVSRSLVKGWLASPLKMVGHEKEDVSSTKSDDYEASWLLIFDNADDPTVLADYWPEGPGSILITSRDPLAKCLFSSRPLGMDLSPMNESEGSELVLRLTGHEQIDVKSVEYEYAEKISRQLAGLPLAISQMASIIRRQELEFSEFLEIYQEQQERASLYSTRYDTGPKSYSHSIATAWAFEKLTTEARDLLKLTYFLDPDAIPESILFQCAVRLSGRALTKSEFNTTRTELSQSSLIRREKSRTESFDFYISVHRIVQEAIGAEMGLSEVGSMFKMVVAQLWETWPSAMPPPTKPSELLQSASTDMRYNIGRYPLCDALYPHVLRLKQVWQYGIECETDAKVQFAALLNDAAWYQHERGRYRGFDGFWDLSQELCEQIPGDDSLSILSSIHFFQGLIYDVTNDLKTARRHKEAFFKLQKTICEAIGPEFVDKRLGLAYAEMVIAYFEDDQIDEAVAAAEREMVIREMVGVKGLVSRDATFAAVLMLRGDLGRAEEILLACVKLWEETGSEKSLRIARFFHELGNLRDRQGRPDEAFEWFSKALSIYIDTKGIHSHRTAEMRYKTAVYMIHLERFPDAVTAINTALQIWSYNAEVFKPELARATYLKATLLEKLGKTQKANLAYKVAGQLRGELVPAEAKKKVKELTMDDFTKLLSYRAR